MNKKALLFGANGYLGRHIAHYLSESNIEFIPLGKSEKSIDGFTNYISIDVTDFEEIRKLDFTVDYIFIFSGVTGTNIGFKEYETFIKTNEVGLLNILNHYVNNNCKARIIFPSTRLVYKGKKNWPLLEEDEKEAKTIYAQNKLSCENYLKMYQNYFNINYTIFRICIPYGNLIDDLYSYGTIGFFLSKANSNENITLFGDGSLKRTFTHVGDIIDLILLSIDLESTKNKIFNIGSNDDLSLLEIANLIAKKHNVKVEFQEWSENALKIESGDTIFNGNKLQQLIDYKYKYSFKDWIEKN